MRGSRILGRLGGAAAWLRSSMAARCLACLLVYALVGTGIVSAVDAARNAVFDNAFPSMETVLERRDALDEDNFEALSDSSLSRCQIIIFDADGERLYASSRRIARRIHPESLSIINDYDQRTFYEVFRTEAGSAVTGTEGADAGYLILRCTMKRGGSKTIQAFCQLDRNLTIRSGTLFSGRTALKRQEFDFIRGIYNAKMSVERYEYTTSAGAARTLVLVRPLVSGISYDRVVEDADRLWIVAAPIFAAVTIIAAWLLAKEIRRATRPLGRAISTYRTGAGAPAEAEQIPAELASVYESFTDLMAQLDRARDDRRRFITDISHDLKTPLTVIRGYAKAFTDGLVPPDRQRECHRAISDKAVMAADMIDSLFEYAKMDHPEYRPVRKRVDLGETVRRICAEATPQIDQAHCFLELEVPSERSVAPIDAGLFRHMLLNLTSNACVHNPQGTRIQVSCARRAGRFTISVADDGVGIPLDIASRAFEPFVTVNTARTAGGGTGLGLAIAKRAAELNGCSIRILERPRAPWHTEIVIEVPLERS